MFERFLRMWQPRNVERTLLGVSVRLEKVGDHWYAMFRAWDRGNTDAEHNVVPEHVAIRGIDASDAMKQARRYLHAIREQHDGDFVLVREAHTAAEDPHRVIHSVFIVPDGACVVFDGQGAQLTRYQGAWDAVAARVMRDAPANTEFRVAFPPAAAELRAANRGWRIFDPGSDASVAPEHASHVASTPSRDGHDSRG